ncbi:MAG: hypothetical protein IJ806_01700 [Ruminococcus sp.]|nr:hypothetical protein [Ruminococcus sp.]
MYDNIELRRSLYTMTGKSFTQALAELDPDSAYADTDMKGLDAYERQLKRFGIRVSGPDSDLVEKFFVTAQSAVLFPEYIRRMIKKGIDETSLAGDICAAVSYTDSMDYRGLDLTTESGEESSIADEGSALPVSTVRLSSQSKRLTKFARILNCSYESVRKQRLETFGVLLREMGASIAREMNRAAANTLRTGAPQTTVSGTAVTYADLAAFWSSMTDHNMDVMLCTPAMMADILALDEMKFCVSDFMSSGKVRTPYGVTIIKCPEVPAKTVIGLDSGCAAELILGTDVVVDYDKLISSQCDEITCSICAGVSKLTEGSVSVLKTN